MKKSSKCVGLKPRRKYQTSESVSFKKWFKKEDKKQFIIRRIWPQ
jgi:hypothetical protein